MKFLKCRVVSVQARIFIEQRESFILASIQQFTMNAHNVINVPEFKLHPGCRTSFRWGPGNELILFQQPKRNVNENVKIYGKSVC